MSKRRGDFDSRIRQGSLVEYDGLIHRVLHLIDEKSATATLLETGETRLLSLQEVALFRPEANDSRPALDAISEKDRQTATERLDALRPILDVERPTRADVEARAAEVGVSTGTMYDWLRRYRAGGDIASLIPAKRGWKRGQRRIDTFVEEVIAEVIENYYLTTLRPSVTDTVSQVWQKCRERKLAAPSRMTIQSRIDRIHAAERLKRRGQPDRARNEYQPAAGEFPDAEYPLSVVQVDHTRTDLMLVDEEHRMVIGRPWITLAIDVFSRIITGYYLSFDAPSATSVGMCLAQSMLSKEDWLLRHDVDAEWPIWGVPDKIHVDNGPDFRSESLKFSCNLYDIDIDYRPAGAPHFGGHVERVIGTLMNALQGLPGATFSSVAQRGETKPEKSAAMTKGEFEKWLLIWICKSYHNAIHRGIDTTPLARWKQGLVGTASEPGRGAPERPSNPEQVTRDFLPAFHRSIQRQGVSIDNLRYYANCLSGWIAAKQADDRNKARKFTFRRDPRDISKIWFFDPDLEEYFEVPLADQALPPISIWEFRHLRKQLADEGIRRASAEQVLDARAELREVEESAQGATKKAKSARLRKQKRADHEAQTTPPEGAESNTKSSDSDPPQVPGLTYGPVKGYDVLE